MTTGNETSEEEAVALGTFIKLIRATNRVNTDLAAGLAKSGLTHSQLAVLECLLHRGTQTQAQLKDRLLISKSNVSNLVQMMVKRGWVDRRPSTEDRRLNVVSLTDEGRERIEAVFPAHARRISNLFAVLTLEEQRQLGELCKKVGTAAPTTG